MNSKNAAALVAGLWIFGGTLAGGLVLGPEVAAVPSVRVTASDDWGHWPQCRLEDGSDVDGQCIWISPRTGDAYLNPTPDEVDDAVYTRGYTN
jgi:hypothetical protein